jgi:hypothetical protein
MQFFVSLTRNNSRRSILPHKMLTLDLDRATERLYSGVSFVRQEHADTNYCDVESATRQADAECLPKRRRSTSFPIMRPQSATQAPFGDEIHHNKLRNVEGHVGNVLGQQPDETERAELGDDCEDKSD